MTLRSIRRAAERKARKLARKAEKQVLMQAATAVPEADMPDLDLPAAASEILSEPNMQTEEAVPAIPKTSSPAQLAANRANAQLSTGPRTAAGKHASCLNAGLDEAAFPASRRLK